MNLKWVDHLDCLDGAYGHRGFFRPRSVQAVQVEGWTAHSMSGAPPAAPYWKLLEGSPGFPISFGYSGPNTEMRYPLGNLQGPAEGILIQASVTIISHMPLIACIGNRLVRFVLDSCLRMI